MIIFKRNLPFEPERIISCQLVQVERSHFMKMVLFCELGGICCLTLTEHLKMKLFYSIEKLWDNIHFCSLKL